jgi:UDP-perosamine 4-acetyltransferase
MPGPDPKDAVVIIGAGGHAKVVIDLLNSSGVPIFGLTDVDGSPRRILGAPVLGNDEILPSLFTQGVRHAFVALGDNRLRLAMGTRVHALGFDLVNAISPRATISPSARLGRGVAIMAGAVINADAQIGDLAIINTGAGVDHDTFVGRGSHVGPGAAVAGGVHIGSGALLGVGSSVAPGCSIGEGATIGAGACVIDDIAPDLVAVGVPARARGEIQKGRP